MSEFEVPTVLKEDNDSTGFEVPTVLKEQEE
jgi:hypothetical protein